MISPSSSDDTLADIKTESSEVQPLLNDSRVLTFRQRQVQGFANLLTAVFPFGKKFRQMNMIRKIVHIIKVRSYNNVLLHCCLSGVIQY